MRAPAFRLRHIARLALPALAAGLLTACGGGSSGDDSAVPLFAGTYFVVLDKTVDDCRTGAARRIEVIQIVTQSGRAVTLTSNQIAMTGVVDPDNLGISVSNQATVDGIPVTYGAVYRASSTPGLFGAGLSIVATDGRERCTIAYNGQAQLQ
jgi:hypothetical protein